MRLIFSIFILSFTFFLRAQVNLVPNSSFEQFSSCPNGSGQISLAVPWTAQTNNSVDYYNSCAPSTSVSVPYTANTFQQYARTGNAYAGIWTYAAFGPSNYREYLQIALSSSLVSNKCYYVEFFVSLQNNIRYGANNIGCNFSNTAISTTGTGYLLNLPTHILKFNNKPIIDTLNWVKVNGIYMANGAEQFLTIGNFFNDNNTDTLFTGYPFYQEAYYFIEDVSVISTDSIVINAYASKDTLITQGDSIFIGQEIYNLNCNWYILGGAQIATNTSGLYVQPNTTTT